MEQSSTIVGEAPIEDSRRRQTFDQLYRTHAAEGRRVAYLFVGDASHAEDIVQEAFIRVLGRFGEIRNPLAFKTYLLRTVVSLSKNHFRRSALERRHQPLPEAMLEGPVERDHELIAALARLPYRQRAAVVLRYCEDLSESDTAEILHTSIKAVQSLVRRGLAALRKEVQR